jgi:hypothetical protein
MPEEHARFQIVTEWQPTAIGSSRRAQGRFRWKNNHLGVGSLGDTCSKETEVKRTVDTELSG